jgi:hypothetical protein
MTCKAEIIIFVGNTLIINFAGPFSLKLAGEILLIAGPFLFFAR